MFDESESAERHAQAILFPPPPLARCGPRHSARIPRTDGLAARKPRDADFATSISSLVRARRPPARPECRSRRPRLRGGRGLQLHRCRRAGCRYQRPKHLHLGADRAERANAASDLGGCLCISEVPPEGQAVTAWPLPITASLFSTSRPRRVSGADLTPPPCSRILEYVNTGVG
jgi:hypothetical protein